MPKPWKPPWVDPPAAILEMVATNMIVDSNTLLAGVDVGSTTVKLVLAEPGTFRVLHRRYMRHLAEQADTVQKLLVEAHELFPERSFRLAVCGSGGQAIARDIEAFFVQEVVANGIAIRRFFPNTSCAIEIGGQDAKVIFFERDEHTGQPSVSDMRMNGVCAGGTGAFIDQVAELLRVSPEEFGGLAARGKQVYEISGRCGVFARTDIQPLLNQGVRKEDIALSSFHAIAKQIIGGLAQGRRLTGPVVFEGGPLTYQPGLVRVFEERLNLKETDGIVPEGAETLVALGAAISTVDLFDAQTCFYKKENLTALNERVEHHVPSVARGGERFFQNDEERRSFSERFPIPAFVPASETHPPGSLEVYLGIDAGSTTSKFVLMDTEGRVVDKFYRHNQGDPVETIRDGLRSMRAKYARKGIDLRVLGAGSTGYGETLIAEAFRLDFHTVETVAHTRGAIHFSPNVSFILDIGGQDMKAVFVERGVPVNFVLNEACSAGCGSFIETYSNTLSIPVDRISATAFESDRPSRLGSRCTVFMNSAVITEQKNGRSVPDIVAGLCQSVVENALSKVLRISNFDVLGENIVVQGGTFKNDAILRAFEQKVNRKIVRPPHPGEVGAIGTALLAREHMEANPGTLSTFSWESLENFSASYMPASTCSFCTNHCKRTVAVFSTGSTYVTGNRCEKGEIIDEDKEVARQKLRAVALKMKSVADLPAYRERLLAKDFLHLETPHNGTTIGIPRSLEFWDSLPFWKAFHESLGYRVVVSSDSSQELLGRALQSISSDTICLPAKLAHGHVQDLIERKVDRIFHPLVMKILPENPGASASWMCPVIQGYSEVVRIQDGPFEPLGISYDQPVLQYASMETRNRQIIDYASRLGHAKKEILKAIAHADDAKKQFTEALWKAGSDLIDGLGPADFAVVLAGRPYHSDSFINHDLARHFTRLGIPVLDLDSLPGLDRIDISSIRLERNNVFHTRLLAAGMFVARHPRLEMAQIVSFGCGHDAVLSDELTRVMNAESGKIPLVLKLDESENRGPIGIRVRSFIETIRKHRSVSV